jgi:hypothetical protein
MKDWKDVLTHTNSGDQHLTQKHYGATLQDSNEDDGQVARCIELSI